MRRHRLAVLRVLNELNAPCVVVDVSETLVSALEHLRRADARDDVGGKDVHASPPR